MSWQDDAMADQDCADALFGMGEAEWRDMFFESMKRAKEDQDKILKKVKSAEYNKKWRESHPEKVREYNKRWRENHKEELKNINRENAANWRSNNRDKYNEYHREWHRKKKANEVQNS